MFVRQIAMAFGDLHVLHPFCGPGLVARHMVGDVKTYFGIDRCPNVVEYARKSFLHPCFRFECADVFSDETLSELQNYSLALLDYEVLNGLPKVQAINLIDRLAGCLSVHGFIAGDVAVAADFMEITKTMTICNHGSWLSPVPHIEVCEISEVDEEGLVTEQTSLIALEDGQIIGGYRDSFWPLTEESINEVLGLCGFRIVATAKPFAALSLDPGRLRNNTAFCARYEGKKYA
jgi:hypothetical protein